MDPLTQPLLPPNKNNLIDQIADAITPPLFSTDAPNPTMPLNDNRKSIFDKYFTSSQNLLKILKTDEARGINTQHKDLLDWRKGIFGLNESIEPLPEHSFLNSIKHSCEDITLIILFFASCISLFLGVLEKGIATGWIEGLSILFTITCVIVITALFEDEKEINYRLSNHPLLKRNVIVIRDNDKYIIDTTELLVGDIIICRAGDQINVDGILIEGLLTMNETAIYSKPTLTIKHTSFQKAKLKKNKELDANPIILSGTYVQKGQGKMVVCTVGSQTMYSKYYHKYKGVNDTIKAKETKISFIQEKLNAIMRIINEYSFFMAVIIFFVLVSGEIWNRMSNPMSFFTTECIDALVDAFLVTLCILVVAVPEGIGMVLSNSITNSLSCLSEAAIVVKDTSKLETMGVVDTICTDKIGTLTLGKMRVKRIYINGKIHSIEGSSLSNLTYAEKDLLNEHFSSNMTTFEAKQVSKENKVKVIGNLTERAIFKLLKRNGYKNESNQGMLVLPYSSKYNYMMSIYSKGEEFVLYTRGEPDSVFPFIANVSSLEGLIPIDEKLEELNDMDIEYTKLLYKSAFFLKKTISKAEYVEAMQAFPEYGLGFFQRLAQNSTLFFSLGIEDIKRKEAQTWILQSLLAGINIKLVTDEDFLMAASFAKTHNIISHPEYDKAIRDIQLIDKILKDDKDSHDSKYQKLQLKGLTSPIALTGQQFQHMTKGMIKETIRDSNGHIKVLYQLRNKILFNETVKHLKIISMATAKDKFLLMYGLRELGFNSALTIEKLSDLKCLSEVSIGIGLGKRGDAIAKDFSDIVLLDDSFKSIILGCQYGRNLYDNVRKFLQFQITSNFVTVFITLIGSLLYKDSPLNPIKLLWINLIIDSFASLSFATEEPNYELLLRRPYKPNEMIFTKMILMNILTQVIFQLLLLSLILIHGHAFFRVPSDQGLTHDVWDDVHGYHLTIFFNVLVYLQVFNAFNVKKIHQDERELSKDVGDNTYFLSIQFAIVLIQLLLVNFGGSVVRTKPLSLIQNILCLLLGALSLFVGHIVKSIYDSGEEAASYSFKDHDNEYREQLARESAKAFKRKKSSPRKFGIKY